MRVASHVGGLLTGASQALASSALAVAALDLQAHTVKKHMEDLGLYEMKAGPNTKNIQGQETESGSASTTRMARESEMTEAASALTNATAQLQAVRLLLVRVLMVLWCTREDSETGNGKVFIPNMGS